MYVRIYIYTVCTFYRYSIINPVVHIRTYILNVYCIIVVVVVVVVVIVIVLLLCCSRELPKEHTQQPTNKIFHNNSTLL